MTSRPSQPEVPHPTPSTSIDGYEPQARGSGVAAVPLPADRSAGMARGWQPVLAAHVSFVWRAGGRLAEFADARTAFRYGRLLPDVLYRAMKEAAANHPGAGLPSTGRLAMAFAACAYPQRAFQMERQAELPRRAEALVRAYGLLARAGLPADAPAERLAGALGLDAQLGVGSEEVMPFLADLSGVDLATAAGTAGTAAATSAADRLRGAALHLATSHADMLGRMFGRWREDGGFVRYFRTYLPLPPSQIADDPAREPDWDRLRAALARRLPGPARYHETAVVLERAARFAAGRGAAAGDVAGACWEKLWAKMTSGFVTFGFRSRFLTWWTAAAGNVVRAARDGPEGRVFTGGPDIFGEDDPPSAAASTDVAARTARQTRDLADDPAGALDPQTLGDVRDLYRIVRATFFGPRSAGPAGEGPGGAAAGVAAANEGRRRLVDALWAARVANPAGNQNLASGVAQRLAEQFAVEHQTVCNLSRQLRLRMRAAVLARAGRQSTADVLAAARREANVGDVRTADGGGNSGGGGRDEPGVATVVWLVRSVPRGRSMLWAFTAHLALHAAARPQQPDPWDWPRYVREWWHWVNTVGFDRQVRDGAGRGGRPDGLAVEAMDAPAGRPGSWAGDLYRRLLSAAGPDDLVRQGPNGTGAALRNEPRDDIQSLVRRLIGPAWVGRLESPDATRVLRQWAAANGHHRLVPVLYARLAEGVAGAGLCEWLDADGRTPPTSRPCRRPSRPARGRRATPHRRRPATCREAHDESPAPAGPLPPTWPGDGSTRPSWTAPGRPWRPTPRPAAGTPAAWRASSGCPAARPPPGQRPSRWRRVAACRDVRRRIDELADMTDAQREQEMPTFAAHLKACDACGQALGNVRSDAETGVAANAASTATAPASAEAVWQAGPAAAVPPGIVAPDAGAVVQSLGRPIRVLVSPCGRLRAGGGGPAPRQVGYVHKAALRVEWGTR